MVDQSAADHDDNMGSVINCINDSGRFGQSAALEFDGPKLGMEVKAEVHDVKPVGRPLRNGKTANNY